MNEPTPPEKRALELLGQHSNIVGPPIPVEDLARALGAEVAYDSFDGEISGMLYRDGDRAIIGVNSRHAPTRQRFTVAHEIAHLLLHPGKPVYIDRFVRMMNFRDGSSDPDEVAANAFAAELLMPREFMSAEIHRITSSQRAVTPQVLIADLAKKFRVSPAAMSYRLTNLDFLDPYSLAG